MFVNRSALRQMAVLSELCVLLKKAQQAYDLFSYLVSQELVS